MSVTALEVFQATMNIADEIDEDTGVIDPDDTSGYQYRTPFILNTLQAELLKSGDVFSAHEISNKPAANMIGYTSGFDYVELTAEEKTIEANGSVKAYYFEIDIEKTVYVEDFNGSWNTLATINVPSTVTNFTAYSGIVTPTAGATKSRLRFVGNYRGILTNYAMFDDYYSASRVPVYRPWVEKAMPSDFKSVDQIIDEYPTRQYSQSSNFKWEGRNKLYINYFYEGNIRIVYRPVPIVLTSINDTLQVDDVTARTLLPLGLGMELYKDENDNLYKHFSRRYKELKALSMVKQPATEEMITNLYGGINC